MVPYKLDYDALREAAKESGGVLISVAARLGVHRKTLAEWRDRIPEVKQILDEELDQALDIAERNLIHLVFAGELKAITYFLSTRGKSRGFTTKIENELSGSIESKVTVYLPDNQRGDRDLDAIDHDVEFDDIPQLKGIEHSEGAPCVIE